MKIHLSILTMTLVIAFQFLTVDLKSQVISFEDESTSLSISTITGAESMDLNNDGLTDIIGRHYFDDRLFWYPGLGDGLFDTEIAIDNDVESPEQFHITDLDGDGDNDLILVSIVNHEILWYENDGNTNFADPVLISSVSQAPKDALAEDMDNDGDMDVIVVSFVDDEIVWYENQGMFPFTVQHFIGAANGPTELVVGHINSDEFPDVITHGSNSELTNLYLTNGLDSFDTPVEIGDHETGLRYSLVDIDLDGDLDYIPSKAEVWYENDGDGVFSTQNTSLNNESFNSNTLAGDLDNDGDIDIINCQQWEYFILENPGDQNFGFVSHFTTDFLAGSIPGMLSDIDNDGDLDVFFGNSWLENTSEEGCTDVSACNYDPTALEEDDSCCYICDCTNEFAENYNPDAECDDGSCIIKIFGYVYHDHEPLGVFDENDYGLPFRQVQVPEQDLTILTNDHGYYEFYLTESIVNVEAITDNAFPYPTTFNPQVVNSDFIWSNQYDFGLSDDPYVAFCVDLYPNGAGFLCDSTANFNICFRNMGYTSTDGIVEFEYDELFPGYQEVTPIDSVDGNTLYMSFQNLLPGQMFMYDVILETPSVDHIGEYIVNTARVQGTYSDDQTVTAEEILVMEITCAYDPNDKQVFPIGYSDEHYIAENEELEFLVRFQNTGNAPAQDIHVIDTIDINFDLNTLQIMANSHSVMTTIDEANRVVDFFFQDIMLPDSVNNEPESHGLISYRIRPVSGLPLLTELNNTAYIYFDNNPPIITNTTWSTIYDCSLFEVAHSESGTLLIANDADSYQWLFNGEPINGATEQEFSVTEDGYYSVEMMNGFPCTGISEESFVVSINSLEGNDINVFPNPARQHAFVNITLDRFTESIHVLDLNGREIESISGLNSYTSAVLKLDKIEAGGYLLKFQNTDSTYQTRKLVIE